MNKLKNKKRLRAHKKHHDLTFRVLSTKKSSKKAKIRTPEKLEIDERNLREIPSLN